MGTRHLICVTLNGEYKVAQYGQWDGYPTEQGQTIVDFISQKMILEDFKQAVSECRFISDKEFDKALQSCGIEGDSIHCGSIEDRRFHSRFPELERDSGGEILRLIQDFGKRNLRDSLSFAKDSLYCEWAYVIDLDKEVLEVYKGFQETKPPKNNRFGTRGKKGSYQGAKTYYPVALVASYSFSQVKDERYCIMKDLEKSFEDKEEAA